MGSCCEVQSSNARKYSCERESPLIVSETSNEDQPLISFVVLCYNTEKYVSDCIRSILSIATDLPFEIVAMDDHSLDRTYDVLQSFRDPRLRIFRNERNLGQEFSIDR